MAASSSGLTGPKHSERGSKRSSQRALKRAGGEPSAGLDELADGARRIAAACPGAPGCSRRAARRHRKALLRGPGRCGVRRAGRPGDALGVRRGRRGGRVLVAHLRSALRGGARWAGRFLRSTGDRDRLRRAGLLLTLPATALEHGGRPESDGAGFYFSYCFLWGPWWGSRWHKTSSWFSCSETSWPSLRTV